MTKISITILLIFISVITFGQDVSYKNIKFKHKKGFVIVNEQKVFKLKYSVGYYYLYDLETGEEVMYFYMNDNETAQYYDDDYVKVYFTKSKTVFETKVHQRIILERLINEKVITSNWKIDASKIAEFVEKYDENITNRTQR
jgi:hypothetical protein